MAKLSEKFKPWKWSKWSFWGQFEDKVEFDSEMHEFFHAGMQILKAWNNFPGIASQLCTFWYGCNTNYVLCNSFARFGIHLELYMQNFNPSTEIA